MSEWIDVPVDQVAKGDEIKVRGTGDVGRQTISFYFAEAERWRAITQVDEMLVWFGPVRIDRLNITAARRRKPEPQPKPGDWRCRKEDGSVSPCIWRGDKDNCQNDSEVYRASGGWSRDTRTGEPWVPKPGEDVEVRLRRKVSMLQGGAVGFNSNMFANYVGRDEVFMVERRKR